MINVVECGLFRADLTTLSVGPLMLQRRRETLAHVSAPGVPSNRVGLLGWFGDGQLPVVRGVQVRGGNGCLGPDMQSHHSTFGPNDFVALTLDVNDLARAAIDLTGKELAVTAGQVFRPLDELNAHLLSLVDAATRVIRSHPKISDATRLRGVGAISLAADGDLPAKWRGA
jgi:hypothetical protein